MLEIFLIISVFLNITALFFIRNLKKDFKKREDYYHSRLLAWADEIERKQ